jgi:HEAT repeat protein
MVSFTQIAPAAVLRALRGQYIRAARTGNRKIDKCWIAALTDDFWQVRLKAIRSLGKMKVDRAVRPIGKCITHEQANLRKEAAAALGEIADPAAEPFLVLVANDHDPEVRKNARWALQQIVARKAKTSS